jgi:RNA polymerase sigma-70 factor (ECF subfamily)
VIPPAASLGALDDAELAILAIGGRDPAFAELVRRHRQHLYRLILSNVADPDEALDLVQETFFAAHRALGRYDPERSMRGWLAAIALNKCRDWGRRRAVRRLFRLARPIDEAGEIAHDDPGPDVEADARRRMAQVASAISELPAALREVLTLRTVEGLSQTEAADLLGITGKAVETRLYRARAKLQALLGEGK